MRGVKCDIKIQCIFQHNGTAKLKNQIFLMLQMPVNRPCRDLLGTLLVTDFQLDQLFGAAHHLSGKGFQDQLSHHLTEIKVRLNS